MYLMLIALVKRRTEDALWRRNSGRCCCGCVRDFSVRQTMGEYIEPMEPNPHNHARYMDYFALYKSCISTEDDYRELATLREQG